MKKLVLILIAFSFILFSCENKKEDLSSEKGIEYFPLNAGKYYIYQVDSIIYDDFNQSVDTFHSRLRVRYVNEFIDSTNTPVMRVETDNPDKDFNAPQNRRVSVLRRANSSIIDYTDTFRTIKMVFPVRNNKKWNSNLYNNRDEQIFYYKNEGMPFDIPKNSFKETATVVQNELKTLITEINAFEVYAKNVGMVYSENTFIQRFDGKVSGKKIITYLLEHN